MALPWLIGAAAVAGAAALFKETCKECGDTFYSSDCSKYCDYCCEERREARRERQRVERERREKEEKEKNQKLGLIEIYKNNKLEFFQNEYNIDIEFNRSDISIIRKSPTQENRVKQIKSLEEESKELSEVISILKDKRDAVS